MAASSGGEDGAELGEGALQGLLRASGLLESMRCVAADVYKGSAWPGDRQRGVIAAALRTHRRGVPGKIPCAVLVDGSMQGSSGPLDSTGNFGIELRSRWRGQGGRNRAGDVEFHGRSTYRRRRPGGIPVLRGRSSGKGRCRVAPGLRSPRIDAVCCCRCVQGVSVAGGSPAASNCDGA